MQTAGFALKYDRLLGCYAADDHSKGDYSGNSFLIESKGAWKPPLPGGFIIYGVLIAEQERPGSI